MTVEEDLAERVVTGDRRALARAITRVENRDPGYRGLVGTLYRHAGDAHVLGITGSPGAGKSTLVDRLVTACRERGQTVGVVAVDPSSPFSGGAVLGDRIRMETAGDPGVFVRSMGARGAAGGLSAATADAVAALDAAGFDWIVVETVGAGQSEIEVVRIADTVAVLVPPSSGDDVQMLKAGILEIADVFVVNKADLEGADHTVRELGAMLDRREHGAWTPPVVETVATEGDGAEELLAAIDAHREYLVGADSPRDRHRAAVRALLREAVDDVLAAAVEREGGIEALADRVADGESDPHAVVDGAVGPLRECLEANDK